MSYCYGYTDFAKYVRECWVPYMYVDYDPGSRKMSEYYWFSKCDDSFCPYGKGLATTECTPNPKTGEYNKAMCDGPNKPKTQPASGNPYIPDAPAAQPAPAKP
jgi:hypothetical protein